MDTTTLKGKQVLSMPRNTTICNTLINSNLSYPHCNLKSPSQYTSKASRITAKTAVRAFIIICRGIKLFPLTNES